MDQPLKAEFTGRRVAFTLPYATLLLNPMLRTHWAKLGRIKKGLAWDVKILTHGQRPPNPFARAHVRIERCSVVLPDYDGMVGGLKALIDVLLPPGTPRLVRDRSGGFNQVFPHPGGLLIIADDNPSCMILEAVAVKISRSLDPETRVLIRELA